MAENGRKWVAAGKWWKMDFRAFPVIPLLLDASEPAEEPAPDSTVGESGIIPLNVILNFIIIVVYGEIYFDHE